MLSDSVSVVIQAVQSRRADVDALVADLAPAIPRIVWHEPGATCLETTARSFLAGDHERSWLIRFEDDVRLCPNFWSIALPLVESIPSGIEFATLYNGRRVHPGEPVSLPPRWEIRPGARFSMTQCVVVRIDLARKIAEHYPGWAQAHPRDPGGMDTAIADLLSQTGRRYAAAWPSLVQHRLELPSMLGHKPHPNRMSPSYRAAFGDEQ